MAVLDFAEAVEALIRANNSTVPDTPSASASNALREPTAFDVPANQIARDANDQPKDNAVSSDYFFRLARNSSDKSATPPVGLSLYWVYFNDADLLRSCGLA